MITIGKIALFVIVATMTLSPSISHAETLHIGGAEWRPWIIKKGNSLTGIVIEICKEAIKRAGHDSVVIEIPQKRRDLIEWGRKITVEAGCDKSWRKRFEDVSVYTEPYIETRNVVVSYKGAYPVTDTIETFHGQRIGCNLGFYYTDGFNEAFDQGKIIRDDSKEGPYLIKKLLRKRYNAVIADTLEWKYWMKEMGHDISKFEECYRFNQVTNLRMRLHVSKKHLVDPLNKSLESMKADSTTDNIVKTFISD